MTNPHPMNTGPARVKEQIAKIIGKYPFGLGVIPLVIQCTHEVNDKAVASFKERLKEKLLQRVKHMEDTQQSAELANLTLTVNQCKGAIAAYYNAIEILNQTS